MARKNRVLWSSSYYMERRGLHGSSSSEAQMRNTVRRARHLVKKLLRHGEHERALDVIVSAGYLD